MTTISCLYHEVRSMLASLLEPDKAQSLERLQLVSLSFESKENIDLCAKLTMNQQDQKLVLKKYVNLENISGLLEIEYFIRGQKKYYVPEILNFDGEERDLGRIEIADIKKFLGEIKINHEYFFNKNIFDLIGRKNIPVSVFLILDLIMNNMNHNFVGFKFVFKQEIFVGDKLKFLYKKKEHVVKFMLSRESSPVVYAEVCCDK